MRRKSGFTLIELLIVIAIIAILTAILLPVFATVRENARAQSTLSNMHQISTAIAQFRLDNHQPPAVLFGYVAYMYNPGSTGSPVVAPMSEAYDQAAAAGVADQYFPGLYPEYVKDYHVFTDANNPDNEKISDIASMYVNDLQTDGSLTPTRENFYKADALDMSPAIITTGSNALLPATYVVRYQASWTNIDSGSSGPLDCQNNPNSDLCGTNGEDLYTHQLRWRNPPSSSYVTSDTYHVPQSGKVLVLWENGSARKVDVDQFLSCGVSGPCTGSGSLPETPKDASVNSKGVSNVNFWKLDPTGP